MKSLVIYDSTFGNTERIAIAITNALGAAGEARLLRVERVQPHDIQDADLLVLGSPTQGWRETPPMQAFVERFAPGLAPRQRVACFDTRFHKSRWLTGSGAIRMARNLGRFGARPLAEPESFFVQHSEGPLEEGELERAGAWALKLNDLYATIPPAPHDVTLPTTGPIYQDALPQ